MVRLAPDSDGVWLTIVTGCQSVASAVVLAMAATGGMTISSLAHADTLSGEAQAVEATVVPQETGHAHEVRFALGQVGTASYYGRRLWGRRMADGTPMRPDSDNAASRTLPLGTRAQVTNLRNGKAAVVTIRDRGPHARGRIIDLSPHTARQLGFLEAGLAQVEVVPLIDRSAGRRAAAVVARAEHERMSARRRRT